MKKIIISAILLAVLLGGTSCMGNGSDQQNIIEVALVYMEQKYGESFIYVGPWGRSPSTTFELLVASESFPDRHILVQIDNYRSVDDRIFRDNYIAVKYKEESIRFFQNTVSGIFGDVIIFYSVYMGGQSHDLPANATFEEFLADTHSPHVVFIELKASTFSSKNQIENVAELLAASGAHFYLTALVVDDNEFGAHDINMHRENISFGRFVHFAGITISNEGIEITWREAA